MRVCVYGVCVVYVRVRVCCILGFCMRVCIRFW